MSASSAALSTSAAPSPATPLRAADSPSVLARRRFLRHRFALTGLVLLAVIVVSVVLAPLLAPQPPNAIDLSVYRMPPSLAHPLGTDDAGRDVMSRLLYGGRLTLTIGFLVALLSTVIGLIVGAVAGSSRGIVDAAVARATELVLSFPGLIVVAMFAAIFGPSVAMLVVVLTFLAWPTPCLIVRGVTLSMRQLDFVVAARALGAPRRRVIVHHIMPAVLSPLTVSSTVAAAQAILAEAGLSYLGFGVPPPDPSWGNMLSRAQSIAVLTGMPWLWIPPGLAICLTVLSVNLVGDGLRDALDPRQSEARS